LQNKRTLTEITLLDEDSRILELARMLAGDSVSKETLTFAKGLLEKAKG
jgi:DNA repair ATPase RecN